MSWIYAIFTDQVGCGKTIGQRTHTCEDYDANGKCCGLNRKP